MVLHELLATLDERIRPVTLTGQQVLPVVDALGSLFPAGGLVRGTSVMVDGPATTSLALALAVAASGQGSWTALVGLPTVCLVAASELGVALDRVALVPDPAPGTWATVVAALVDAVDLVVIGPCRIRPGDARRLSARARERGAVLLGVGAAWPEAPDVVVRTSGVRWEGIGQGHGRLVARRLEVEVTGRRGMARPRRATLWLPDADGRITAPAPLRSVG
ncbi:MAG: hypothetical protein ACXIVQ_00880 [Acidimicrobiales bacterium]